MSYCLLKPEVTILDQYVFRRDIEIANGYTAVFTTNGS